MFYQAPGDLTLAFMALERSVSLCVKAAGEKAVCLICSSRLMVVTRDGACPGRTLQGPEETPQPQASGNKETEQPMYLCVDLEFQAVLTFMLMGGSMRRGVSIRGWTSASVVS